MWILKLLDRMGRKRIIMDRIESEPYLERYYLLFKDRDRFPFNIFLHKFLRSDPDDVHDHPWPYATLILKGGYWEWVPQFDERGNRLADVAHWRGPGHFRICKATSYHRIQLDPDVATWTLFMPGPKQKDWGFLSKGKWTQWQEYLDQRRAQSQ